MLDEFIKEIKELKEYKREYFNLVRNKQVMSDKLYELMMERYKSMSYEERLKEFKESYCSCCRHDVYDCDIPEDIMMPVKSDCAWIPGCKGCGNFKWA